MRSNYQHSNSFFGKTRVILVLTGIIPILLVVYLLIYESIGITDMVSLLAASALFSVLAGFSLLRRSADHLIYLCQETKSVEAEEKSEPIQIKADQELNDIASDFNSMQKRLKGAYKDMGEQGVQLMLYARDIAESYKKIKEGEALRSRLSRYVGEDLVEKLIDSGNSAFPESERKEVAILFADIRSFSRLAERMAAEEVVSMLNQYFNTMVDIIFGNNGLLDKFAGDQLMAVFGLIPTGNSASQDALKAGATMRAASEELMKLRSSQGKEIFEIGIGINTGSAIVGNVGSENRMDYTVIGDSVNIAARLEKMAKGGQIIIGEKTYLQTQGQFRLQKRGEITLKNKTDPILCYEVLR